MIDPAKTFLGQIVAILPSLDEAATKLDRETGRRFSSFNLSNTDERAGHEPMVGARTPLDRAGSKHQFAKAALF